MSVWSKLFGTTPKQSPLETAFIQQSKALVDAQKSLFKVIEQQQATLDRIVTAKYDTPVFKPQEIENPQMPLFGMSDQDTGYLPSLTEGSDREFLESVGVK